MTGRTCRIAQTGLQGQSALGGPSFSCLWLVLWSKAKAKIQTARNSCKKQRKRPLFKQKADVLWSCWADSNRRPHPYQLTKSCCCLLLFILSYRIQSIVLQYFRQLPPAPCRSLSWLKIYCFLMPVSVLCRFLAEPAPSDLIPTSAVLRPLWAVFLCPVRPIRELQRPGHSGGV